MENMASRVFVILLFCISVSGKLKKNYPPHCTHVTKDTDYVSKFKFDYPVAYIVPGQHEVFQPLFCLNPPSVNKAVTSVCDWAAPPQVQFTLGDEYVHVVRQDPTGRYLGNAVITTYQLCTHNKLPPHLLNDTNAPFLYCLNPPSVNKAVTSVCDWSAPPQVQFTLGDEYVHVVRQDPTGRYIGNAVITTYQLCTHDMVPQPLNHSNTAFITEL